MEETKEEMKETIEDYGVRELLDQYVVNANAFEVLVDYIQSLEKKLESIEFVIDNSEMGTAVENIITIIKG